MGKQQTTNNNNNNNNNKNKEQQTVLGVLSSVAAVLHINNGWNKTIIWDTLVGWGTG
jgi:hypothetical protein